MIYVQDPKRACVVRKRRHDMTSSKYQVTSIKMGGASFLTLLLATCYLLLPSAALADGAYCWCRNLENVCTNHSADQVAPPAAAGATMTTAQCNTFCTTQGEGSRNIHLDATYLGDTYCSNGDCGPGGSCPAAAPTANTPAPAVNAPVAAPIRLFNPLGAETDIPAFIGRGIRGVLGLIGAIALLMFIWGGISWMTAGGEGKRVENAKAIIKNSIIGLLLIFFSYSLIGVFFSFFSA